MAYNATQVKRNNILSLLRIMKRRGAVNKPELAALTGLTNVTVNNIINDLVAKKLVAAEGSAASNGGRKAVQYRLSDEKYRFVGVYLSVAGISVTLYTFNLTPLGRKSWACDLDAFSIDKCLAQICKMIGKLCESQPGGDAHVLGVGVSVPGNVNYEHGIVHNLPKLKRWKDIPLKTLLESRLNLPVFVDNDITAAMIYCKWAGIASNDAASVFLCTVDGIGSGILINGELFRGYKGVSGEFGHIMVNPQGPLCICGSHGCLELYASDLSILQMMRTACAQNRDGALHALCGGNPSKVTFELIAEAVKQGDPDVRAILDEATSYLAMCMGIILNVIAPTEIIILSSWLDKLDEYFLSLVNAVYLDTPYFNRGDVRIILNAVDNILELGSGAIVLNHVLTSVADSSICDSAT